MRPAGTILEINDAELRLHRATGAPLHSPVLAVVEHGELRVGAAARDAGPRDPRHTCDSYLAQLDQTAVGLHGAAHLSAADLLHAHLSGFGEGDAVESFIVAPSFGAAQLALLLGVATRAAHHPRLLVDAAAAAAAIAIEPGEVALYLDPGVRTVHLAHVVADADTAWRGETLQVDGLNLGTARQLWMRWVRERCIALWRMDPLQVPAHTHALVGGWPEARDALAEGRDGEWQLTAEHRLTWSAEQVNGRLQESARALIDTVLAQLPEDGILLLDARVHELPGLVQQLARYRRVRLLHEDALATVVRHNTTTDALPSADASGVPHLLQLRRCATPTAWTAVQAAPLRARTLLLAFAAQAHALRSGDSLELEVRVATGDIQVRRAVEASPSAHTATSASHDERATVHARADHALLDWQGRETLRINGRHAPRHAVLRPGDSVQFGSAAPFAVLELVRDGD